MHTSVSEYFPESAVDLGADVVIQSFHKTLPARTQTAVLHLCSDRVRENLIKRFLGIYQTSSPSYILMSSLDACVDKKWKRTAKAFQEFTENLEAARERLSKCQCIHLVPSVEDTQIMLEEKRVFDYDRSKIIFEYYQQHHKWPELCRILREEFHLETEMTTENYVLAMAAVGRYKEGFTRLCQAVEEIDKREKKKISQKMKAEATLESEKKNRKNTVLKQIMTISNAMDAPCQISLFGRKCWKNICGVCLPDPARNSSYCARRTDNWTFGKECEKIYGARAEYPRALRRE